MPDNREHGRGISCIISAESGDTLKTGSLLGSSLNAGTVITISGVLGVGKTVLVKGIARGLGINEEITSPSFTVISIYRGRLPLYHVDLYRIDDSDQLEDLGLEEYFCGEGITAVEWGEKAASLLPANCIDVSIKLMKDGKRRILINGVSL